MSEKMFNAMKSKRITPEIGKEYEHKSGGIYKCIGIDNEMSLSSNGNSGKSAVLQNTDTGWTLLAHGVNMYENGTIDWEFSTQGRFETLPKDFKFNVGDYVIYQDENANSKCGEIIKQKQTDDNRLYYVVEGADRNIAESNIRYMTFKEMQEQPVWKNAEVIKVIDGAGVEVNSDWATPDAPVLHFRANEGCLEVTVGNDNKEKVAEKQTVKIYEITCYQGVFAGEEGTRYSLEPWEENTDRIKGEDDGGKLYELPDGYKVGEDITGVKHIYSAKNLTYPCNITKVKNTMTIIDYNGAKGEEYVFLKRVDDTKEKKSKSIKKYKYDNER